MTYYKFTDPEDVARKVSAVAPQVEAVTGEMNIHGGQGTRIWASEFDYGQRDDNNIPGLEEALRYMSRAMSGPLKYSIDGIYLHLARASAQMSNNTSNELDIIRAFLSYDGELNWDGSKWVDHGDLNKIPKELLTPNILAKSISIAYKNGYWPRDQLIVFPATSFTQKIKRALLTKDPDTIFYFPEDAVTPEAVLFSIDNAKKQGGFTSPYSDDIEEIPNNFPPRVLTPEVINALKTKIGVPDTAFQTDVTEEMSRIVELSKIK
jgi:hypothetical protein